MQGYNTSAEKGIVDTYDNFNEPYPAWHVDGVPINRDTTQSILIYVLQIFGFQKDNT